MSRHRENCIVRIAGGLSRGREDRRGRCPGRGEVRCRLQNEVGRDQADADRITDFSHTQGDKIDLSAIDASIEAAGDQAFSFIGNALYSGVAGQLRYAVAGGVTTIAGDVDGNGTSDFHIQLTGTIALVAGDFVL